jgi:hypothetical protein
MIGVWREIAYHSLRSGAKFVVKRIMRRAVTDRVRIAD